VIPITIDISFDDGLIDQLKWGRYMQAVGLQGTFYVCPGLVGTPGRLSEEHLKMLADWGHRIAGHTWGHETPQGVGVGGVVESCQRAREWLVARRWDGDAMALTFGTRAGVGWTTEALAALAAQGFKALRDTRFKSERSDLYAPRIAALELPDAMAVTLGFNAFYFHSNRNTTDEALTLFLAIVAQWKETNTARVVLANSTGD